MTTPHHPSHLFKYSASVAAACLAFCMGAFLPGAQAETKEAGLRIAKDTAEPVTLSVLPGETEAMANVAAVLRENVSRMTGVELAASSAPWNRKGILLALTKSLPESESEIAGLLKSKPLEAYAYDINAQRAVIAANSTKALKDGVYALLEQVGCRWLLPSKRWTIIPQSPEIQLPAQKTVSTPDFFYRSIWYAYGIGNLGEEIAEAQATDYKTWCDANRLGGVTGYKIGHTYASTVARHQKEFEAHPEYFAMNEDGTRRPFAQHQSLCYSNPQVAKFFIEDKQAELKADKLENPDSYVVSMDPNDGTVECFCEECKKLGNGSDQALHLANQVARSLRAEFPDAIVTMYAYASHRLPPEKIVAEPNIEIQVAMGFNKTQYTLEQLVALWRKKISSVGARDYFGVMAWDWGLPGRGKAGSYKYVSTYLPKYYSWGVRAFNAETNANWASFGPASYLATKLLWNIKADPAQVYEDFFSKGFGKAGNDVKELYGIFSQSQDLSRQNIHAWLVQLDKAFKAAQGEEIGVRERLTDLAAFLHYAILYRNWELALATNDQDKAYESLLPLLEYTWRIRDRNMVHAYALQRRLVNSGHEKLRPLREGWRFNDPQAKWRHPQLLSDEEVQAIFQKDLAENPPDKRIVTFSNTLRSLGEASSGEEALKGGMRYETVWHALLEKDSPLEFKLPMIGVRANYKLEIFENTGDLVWESEASVTETASRYETKPFEMKVKFPGPGQYKLVFHAGEDYAPHFPPDLKVVLDASQEKNPLFRMLGPGYFYVPKGTEKILVQTDGRFSVIPPGATKRTDYSAAENDPIVQCVAIPVEGLDGQVWTMDASTSGKNALLNIPPYIATDPGRLLVPDDVK